METDTEDEEEEEEDDVVVEEEQEEADETAEQSQDSVDSDVFAADSDEEKHTPMARLQSFTYSLSKVPSKPMKPWQFSESISVFQQVPGHTKKRRIVESDEDGEPQQHIDPGDYGRSRSSRIAKRHKASEPLSVTFPLYFFPILRLIGSKRDLGEAQSYSNVPNSAKCPAAASDTWTELFSNPGDN